MSENLRVENAIHSGVMTFDKIYYFLRKTVPTGNKKVNIPKVSQNLNKMYIHRGYN